MAKKMTVAAINSAAKKTYTMREHNLTDVNGEIWSIAIDEKMNPVHIPKMCQDILVLVAKLHDEGALEDFNSEQLLIYQMIFKYYTDLKITDKETAVETINSYINMMNSLLSLGLVEPIMNCFDKDAMAKTMEEMNKVALDMADAIVVGAKEYMEKAEAEKENIEVVE